VWNYTTGGDMFASTVSGGYVYFGSDDYGVYCLNAQKGASQWNYTTSDYVTSAPAVANGVLYIGSNGTIYAFGTMSNATLSIQASQSSIAVGSSLTLSGSLTPTQSGTVTIWASINGSVFTTLNSTALASDYYAYTFSPSVAGSYQFYASWPGNAQFNAANSTTTAVTVTSSNVTPTLTLQSSYSSVNHGQIVTLSGTISPSTSGNHNTLGVN